MSILTLEEKREILEMDITDIAKAEKIEEAVLEKVEKIIQEWRTQIETGFMSMDERFVNELLEKLRGGAVKSIIDEIFGEKLSGGEE